LVYVAMKPLEWFFLLVLYTVDARPENRIHVQYSGFGKTGRRTENGTCREERNAAAPLADA